MAAEGAATNADQCDMDQSDQLQRLHHNNDDGRAMVANIAATNKDYRDRHQPGLNKADTSSAIHGTTGLGHASPD
eukprot:10228309-Karenia_brevis.AAC.1